MTDCERLRDCLLAGHEPTAALEKHAAECDPCAELLSGDGELGKFLGANSEGDAHASDVSTLFSGLALQLERERGPRAFLRSRPTSLRIALVLIVICGIGVAQLGGLLRADAGVYPAHRLAVELSLLGLLAIGGVVLGLRPQFKASAPIAASIGVAAAAALLPVTSIILGPAHESHASSLAGFGDALLPRAAGCFAYGAIFAAPVLIVAWLLDRGPIRGAALAFAGAATVGGNLALWLHCPITHAAHIGLGHVPLGVCLLAVALLVRRRAARPALI